MQSKRDVLMFAVSASFFASALSAVAWLLPKINSNPADALIVIPVASVILSARGVAWRRRLHYAGLVIGVFALVDAIFLASGLMRYAFAGLSHLDPVPSVLAVTYMFFAQGFPFVVLLIFAGKDPSILWSDPPSRAFPTGRASKSGRRGQRPPKH